MVNTGNTEYKKIPDKQHMTVETEDARRIISDLNASGVLYSARYDDNRITVTFTQDDFDKVSGIIDAAGKEKAKQQAEQLKQSERKNTAKIAETLPPQPDKSDKEVRDTLQKLQDSLDSVFKKLDKLQAQQDMSEAEKEADKDSTVIAENTSSSIQQAEYVPPACKLLPVLNTVAVNAAHRLDTVTQKHAVCLDKIKRHEDKISSLETKAQRLETTNNMLIDLSEKYKLPGIKAIVKANKQKIAAITSTKIPTRRVKLNKQHGKAAMYEKKAEILNCKISRCKNINGIITSFSVLNNAKRREEFAMSMEGLHQDNVKLVGHRIDICTTKICRMTEKYMKTESHEQQQSLSSDISALKAKRQKLIDKRNKLTGIIVPAYMAQPDKVVDSVAAKVEETLTGAARDDKLNINALPENVAIIANDTSAQMLPEHLISAPEVQPDKSLLPEIATLMNMSVSELESKPQDIQNGLILNYTNSYMSDTESLREQMSEVISPNAQIQGEIVAEKEKKQELSGDKREDMSAARQTDKLAKEANEIDKRTPVPKSVEFYVSSATLANVAEKAAHSTTRHERQHKQTKSKNEISQ